MMKAQLIVATIAGLTCAPALAFGDGYLSLYSDAAFTECTLSDTSPEVRNVYLVELVSGAVGLRFRIGGSPGFTGVWLSDTSPFTTVGNSQTDFSVGFGDCHAGRFLVLTMSYQMLGTSTCSQLSIVAPPGFIQPICAECEFGADLCQGLHPLHINCTSSFDCNALAIEPSTWGSVKALYRN